jgi:hypothetical protein
LRRFFTSQAGSFRQEIAARIDLRQSLQRKRGSFGIEINIAAVVIDASRLPVRFVFIALGRAFDQAGNFFGPAVFAFVQRQRQQRAAIRSKVVTLAVEFFQEVTIALTAFSESVDQVSARLVINRVSVVVLAGTQQRRNLLSRLAVTPAVNLITGRGSPASDHPRRKQVMNGSVLSSFHQPQPPSSCWYA